MLSKYVEEPKDKCVSIKVSEREKNELKERAKTADQTMSRYLRNYLPINKNLIEIDDWSYHELHKLAYNEDKSVAQVIEELLKNGGIER